MNPNQKDLESIIKKLLSKEDYESSLPLIQKLVETIEQEHGRLSQEVNLPNPVHRLSKTIHLSQ
jgi:hypothetical protein